MKRNGQHDPSQLELPEFAPIVTIPPIMIPQPGGGFLIKPGKPVIEGEKISTARAAKLLGLSQRTIREMCEEGLLEACRPGRPRGALRVTLQSVLARIHPS